MLRETDETTQYDDRATNCWRSAHLEVVNGPEAGHRIVLAGRPTIIGRGANSGVVLADPDDPPILSRRHITVSPDLDSVSDLLITDHSLNGTWVDGQELPRGGSGLLKTGGMLGLGPNLRLRWRQSSRPEPAIVAGGSGASQVNTGIRGNHVGNMGLRAQITSAQTLQEAWNRVQLNRGGAGPDNVSCREFSLDAARRLTALRDELRCARYQPLPPRLYAAPKRTGGVRTIAILSVRDRIVQKALHMALQTYLEPVFPNCSFAYRPRVSAHNALRAVDSLLRQGLTWVAETDIAAFFDSINHKLLLDKLATVVPDPFVLSLTARCLAVGSTSAGLGIPQGAATSPLFSNLYLAEFDAHMTAGDWNLVRYGDDMVFACGTRAAAQAALAEAEGFLRARLQLSLKAQKTRVTALNQGFTFLGFRFTDAGRQAGREAVERLHGRLAEAAPAAGPATERGWRNYFGQPGSQAESPRPLPHCETPTSEAAPSVAATFLAMFNGREDAFARQSAVNGNIRFTPCAGAITPELITEHLKGETTLACYLMRCDGMVRAAVLDIDALGDAPYAQSTEGTMRGDSAFYEAGGMAAVFAFTRDLCGVCRSYGIPYALEDSGRRGRHLWLLFDVPIPPDQARRFARLIALRAGYPRDDVRLELFPRHSEWQGPELGDAVKLPLGVHPLTGRRCFLLDDEDLPIADPATALARITTIRAAELDALVAALGQTEHDRPAPETERSTEPSDQIGSLIGGCSVIRALVERARTTGHLRHTHQLILLYTAGRLGPEGAAFLHRTIANCRNYNPDICQGYIDRLDAAHKPLGCRRIREWLEEEGEQSLCTCPATRRTPLELCNDEAYKITRAKPTTERGPTPEDASQAAETARSNRRLWLDVAEDMFCEQDLPPLPACNRQSGEEDQ